MKFSVVLEEQGIFAFEKSGVIPDIVPIAKELEEVFQ